MIRLKDACILNKIIINTQYHTWLIGKYLLITDLGEYGRYKLVIAGTAYLIGAVIEGVNIVSQLSDSACELDKATRDDSLKSTNSSQLSWQIWIAIASVSICGSLCWPCRLLHRSIKWIIARFCEIFS